MNRDQPVNTLNGLQLSSIILGAMLGLGPLMNVRFATLEAGRDAWISIILAAILILINLWIMTRVVMIYPNKTIAQIISGLMGTWLGKIGNAVNLVLSLMICAITLWYTGHIFNVYILLFTPSIVLSSCLLFVSVYTTWFDVRIIGRVVVVLFFVSFLFAIFFVPPVLQYGQIERILPIGKTGFSGIWHGMLMVMYSFAGYERFLVFAPFLDKFQGMTRSVLLSVFYVSLMFIVGAICEQLVYPILFLQKLWTPGIEYVSLVNISILERTDLIFILFWFGVLFKTHVSYFYSAVLEMKELMNAKSKTPAIVVSTIIIFATSFIKVNNVEMENWMFWTLSITVGISFIIPISIITMGWLKRKVQ